VTVPGSSREARSTHHPQEGKLPMPMRLAIILGLGLASWAPIVLLLT
jgi:hypothetical protein